MVARRKIFAISNVNAGETGGKSINVILQALADQLDELARTHKGSIYHCRTNNLEELDNVLEQWGPEGLADGIGVANGGDGTLQQLLTRTSMYAYLPTGTGTVDVIKDQVRSRGGIEAVIRTITQLPNQAQPRGTHIPLLTLTYQPAQGEAKIYKGFMLTGGGAVDAFFSEYYNQGDDYGPVRAAKLSVGTMLSYVPGIGRAFSKYYELLQQKDEVIINHADSAIRAGAILASAHPFNMMGFKFWQPGRDGKIHTLVGTSEYPLSYLVGFAQAAFAKPVSPVKNLRSDSLTLQYPKGTDTTLWLDAERINIGEGTVEITAEETPLILRY